MLSQKGIEEAHERLVLTTEEFLKELKSRQEQQRIEEEEMEKLKKIREEQVRMHCHHRIARGYVHVVHNMTLGPALRCIAS